MNIMEDKFYKWSAGKDNFCARVINGTTANYYRNGEVYALYKPWKIQPTDIEIAEKEFLTLINSSKNGN